MSEPGELTDAMANAGLAVFDTRHEPQWSRNIQVVKAIYRAMRALEPQLRPCLTVRPFSISAVGGSGGMSAGGGGAGTYAQSGQFYRRPTDTFSTDTRKMDDRRQRSRRAFDCTTSHPFGCRRNNSVNRRKDGVK